MGMIVMVIILIADQWCKVQFFLLTEVFTKCFILILLAFTKITFSFSLVPGIHFR